MRLLVVFGVIFVCLLVVKFSSSFEVISFHQVTAANGDALCGTSAPNKTLNDVELRVKCVSSTSCSSGCGSRCVAVNYWKNSKLRQLFYYLPLKGMKQDCVVTTISSTCRNRTLLVSIRLRVNIILQIILVIRNQLPNSAEIVVFSVVV